MSTCSGLVVIEAHTHSRKHLHLLSHLFSPYMLPIIPLRGGVIDAVVTKACTGYWGRPPLCSTVVTAPLQGRFCSFVGAEATPCSTSELCECPGVGRLLGLEHSHSESSHQVFLPWSSSPVHVLCCVTLYPFCGFLKCTVVSRAIGPALGPISAYLVCVEGHQYSVLYSVEL